MDTIVVPLLTGNLNFIWNHGWYHTSEEYDTDDECSFFVFDGDNNMLYSSDELEDGIFMTYNNNCDYGTVTCYPVENLQAEYQWHNGEEFGAYLTWDKPTITPYLHHFEVYRGIGENNELIAEVEFDGSGSYSYFDNAYGMVPDDTYYSVRSYYTNGYYQCQSDFREVMVTITDLAEQMDGNVKLYPNPTSGVVVLEGTGHVIVMNTLGQTVKEIDLEGKTTMELPKGLFFVCVNGVTRKVVVE